MRVHTKLEMPEKFGWYWLQCKEWWWNWPFGLLYSQSRTPPPTPLQQGYKYKGIWRSGTMEARCGLRRWHSDIQMYNSIPLTKLESSLSSHPADFPLQNKAKSEIMWHSNLNSFTFPLKVEKDFVYDQFGRTGTYYENGMRGSRRCEVTHYEDGHDDVGWRRINSPLTHVKYIQGHSNVTQSVGNCR